MLKLAPLAMTSDASGTGWRVVWFVTWCSRGFAPRADRRKKDSASPGGADPMSRGKTPFIETGRALYYTPSLRTGTSTVAALAAKEVDLYSDPSLHEVGVGLADGISQGQGTSREISSRTHVGSHGASFFFTMNEPRLRRRRGPDICLRNQ